MEKIRKEEYVVLVDEADRSTGIQEKLVAHREGNLHRAVSVFLFNNQGKMLLQQRAEEKYHSGGLWTNACCSHPFPDELPLHAAIRRLKEEIGLDVANLQYAFPFLYKASLENGLVEHELDHVFIGITDSKPAPTKEEVMAVEYFSQKQLEYKLKLEPEQFTVWFKWIYAKMEKEKTIEKWVRNWNTF